MSAAPAPSPAEQAVIDRFGIFDEELSPQSCPECDGSLMARCGLPCDVCERTGTAEGHARFRTKAAS